MGSGRRLDENRIGDALHRPGIGIREMLGGSLKPVTPYPGL